MASTLTKNMGELQLHENNHEDQSDLQSTVNNLIKRCQTLCEELEIYIAAVNSNEKLAKLENPVEYRNLRNDFKSELAFLKRISLSDMSEEKARHNIVSSNLVYYEALWDAAKRSSGLLNFRRAFYWNHPRKVPKGSKPGSGKAALVDVVASDGIEWIRVATLSEKRLLFDLAKQGWQNDSDDEDEEMADARPLDDDDEEDQVEIVRNAMELAKAARANPIRGRPPKVHFVLTRLEAGKSKEVDMIINKIRATGATVQATNELPPSPALSEVLPNLLVDRSRRLSDTLNIDCTILLALISDISHRQCEILDWYPREVREQIKEESEEKLLPTHLYPAIGSHPMVCTEEAAAQMNLIVDTLATDTEKTRANLLLAQRDQETTSPSERLKKWTESSDHSLPEGFQLPIRVHPSNIDQVVTRLPEVADKIGAELGALNKAIFFFGWAEGITTLSANRMRAKQIDHIINQHGIEEGKAGPHIWLCGESRSLIAKHGRRK
ncbi:hypothetical protein BDV96DRAFT_182965 [Lophiotrema nucula]|uniref:DUF1308 domain-containing protein n=1 Tax=Lophiotrema nucula TaxID=690887 RepID=A0A6A5YX89_9PLEO|nr:hypothetical protein BDV96DRAFT_182965 [Lophiotrema nucula]